MSEKNENNEIENNDISLKSEQIDNSIEIENTDKDNNVKESIVEIENSQFIDRTQKQVSKILKEMTFLGTMGSKLNLSDNEIDEIVKAIREQSNIVKKQFILNLDKEENIEFGNASSQVQKVIKEIKSLSDISNRHSGEYDEDHIKVVFEALKKKLSSVKKDLKNKNDDEDGFSF